MLKQMLCQILEAISTAAMGWQSKLRLLLIRIVVRGQLL